MHLDIKCNWCNEEYEDVCDVADKMGENRDHSSICPKCGKENIIHTEMSGNGDLKIEIPRPDIEKHERLKRWHKKLIESSVKRRREQVKSD